MALNNYILNGPSTVILDDNRDPYVSWQNHLARTGRGGVDLVANIGTPVLAPTDGVVDRLPNNGTAGNSMQFHHDANAGWSDVFSHLSSYVGSDYQHFKQGEIIAYTGNSGGVVQHLHRHLLDPNGVRRNPWDYFGDGSGMATDYGYGLTTDAQLAAQQALTKLALYSGDVDGVFGPMSVTAFQQFLKNQGLLGSDYTVDGEPGPLYGSAVQTLASRYGYTGPIDGEPGAETSKGIVSWAASVVAPVTPPVVTPPTPAPTGSFGIDIATPQKGIDLAAAKAEGVQFVIVKAGGLNVTPQYVAPQYHAQVDAVRAQGLALGHYYLLGAGQTPVEQANYFVDNLYKFDVNADVLALDNERLDGNAEFWTDANATAFFAQIIKRTGIPASRLWLYGSASDFRNNKPWTAVEKLGVKIWWAAYGNRPTGHTPDHTPDLQGSVSDWTVHQYSSSVTVAGKTVDGNYSRKTVAQLFAKGTVTPPVVVPPVVIPPTPAGPDTTAIEAQVTQVISDLSKILEDIKKL